MSILGLHCLRMAPCKLHQMDLFLSNIGRFALSLSLSLCRARARSARSRIMFLIIVSFSTLPSFVSYVCLHTMAQSECVHVSCSQIHTHARAQPHTSKCRSMKKTNHRRIYSKDELREMRAHSHTLRWFMRNCIRHLAHSRIVECKRKCVANAKPSLKVFAFIQIVESIVDCVCVLPVSFSLACVFACLSELLCMCDT